MRRERNGLTAKDEGLQYAARLHVRRRQKPEEPMIDAVHAELPRRVAFLATEEEQAMLQALALENGVTVSGWLRLATRAAYARMTAKKAKVAVKRRTRG